MQDEVTRYGPTALAMVAVSLLIAKYPGYLGLTRESVRSRLLIFNAGFVLFVALDLVSGRALTSLTDAPRGLTVFLIGIAALLVANVIYLFVRGRAPR